MRSTQWQFGDWASLAAINRDTLQHHPDRAKLVLLVAAGHQALGNAAEARHCTRLALEWGCSKKLVSQILIAGVHNTLGRAAAISGQGPRALKHFQASIATGTPASDIRLLTQARAGEQLKQLGLSEPR
jgi:NCAIR mutase (PurE)-related protein